MLAVLKLLFSISIIVDITSGRSADVFGNGRNNHRSKLDISDILLEEILAVNIDNYLRYLTSIPHLAGTAQDLEQADWVRDQFLQYGLDDAKVIPYRVLLSYPNMDEPNKVYLLDENGNAVFTTSGRQDPLYAPEEGSPLIAPNFNAYSGTGQVEGGLVYVYYGRREDYAELEQNGINVTGKIVLARYGSVFRGNTVNIAEQKGAVGVILFSDPQDFAIEGRNFSYPDSWWMPGMAVQSGTVYLLNGDPLTPYYPSIESAYRIPESEATLPKIPVQPIGFDEAEILLQALEPRIRAPDSWQGNLNTVYYLGPNFANPNWKVRLNVLTSNQLATIHNTIGIIHGAEEPDRYVLVGNHRDAWGLGSVDPSSGTAAMLEMARAFGKIKQEQSWRPRRSLVFCSWGAEEYGLIGSYEWVEQFAKVLTQRAVAYLNVDMAVQGNYSLTAKALPTLKSLLRESSKKIPNPNPSEVAAGRNTVFDTWTKCFPDPNNSNQPNVRLLGSGSDFTILTQVYGIPSMDMRFTYEEPIGSYPLYHTLYETHHLSGYLMDSGFLFHRALAQLWAEMARNLADSLILPLNIQEYGVVLGQLFTALESRYSQQLESNGATLSYFRNAVNQFTNATRFFTENVLANLDTANVLAVRRVNDQIMLLERFFIEPRGLPNRPEYNHIVFSPSSSDSYTGTSFAGLTDLLEAAGNQNESDNPKLWAQIKQHLSAIAFYIQAAADSLRDGFW